MTWRIASTCARTFRTMRAALRRVLEWTCRDSDRPSAEVAAMLRLGARESGPHSSAASRGASRGRWQGLARPVGTQYPRSSTAGEESPETGTVRERLERPTDLGPRRLHRMDLPAADRYRAPDRGDRRGREER